MVCRRCSECVGCEHHWIPDPCPDHDYVCKHCDAKGDMCLNCTGDGCEPCKESGVILTSDLPGYEDLNRILARVPASWLGGLLVGLIYRLLDVNFFKTPDDLRKYIDGVITRRTK